MKTTVGQLNQGDIIKFSGVKGGLIEYPLGKYLGGREHKIYTHKDLKVTKFLYLGEFRMPWEEADKYVDMGNPFDYAVYRLFCDDEGKEVRIWNHDWNLAVTLLDDSLEYQYNLRLTSDEWGILMEAIGDLKESYDEMDAGDWDGEIDYDYLKRLNLMWNRIKYLGGK